MSYLKDNVFEKSINLRKTIKMNVLKKSNVAHLDDVVILHLFSNSITHLIIKYNLYILVI